MLLGVYCVNDVGIGLAESNRKAQITHNLSVELQVSRLQPTPRLIDFECLAVAPLRTIRGHPADLQRVTTRLEELAGQLRFGWPINSITLGS